MREPIEPRDPHTAASAMMMRKQDIGALLFYYLGYSRLGNMVLRLRKRPATRIVMFHDVLPEQVAHFKANLDFLRRRTNVVSFDDFFSGRLSSENLNTILTFDDGYKSWVTDAIPVLKALRLPATFFVSSGFVGLTHDEEAEFMRSKLFTRLGGNRRTTGGLRVDEVQTIVAEGFTLGGHTSNHAILSTLRDRVEIRHEIVEDKIRLEKMIGRRISYFAYPSGAFGNPEVDVAEVLKEAGYAGAVTTTGGVNNAVTDPYLLHRELTSASMPGVVFRARVLGNYDPVRFLKRALGASRFRRVPRRRGTAAMGSRES
jgi:peptidoglycan/xylan/chitin deacetylase (PgdA/CDA1 family)